MDFFDILLAKKLNGGGGGDITIEDLYVNENGTVIAPSGKAYGKVVTDVPAPANAIYKQTLSGLPSPIATVNGANAPLDSLKASIVGQQDLHGYDKPWPAGGGKNKYNYETRVDNYYIRNDGEIRTATGSCYSALIPVSGTITLSGHTVDGGIKKIVEYDSNGDFLRLGNYVETTANSDYSVSVTVGTGTVSVRISLLIADTNVQLEEGSTATTYESYSNICPLSGWASCEVTDNNDTYTIQFKDSSDNPINVYRGTIDISTGVATFTHKLVTYNGSEYWRKSGSYDGSFYLPASAVPDRKPDTAFSCNMAKYVDSNYAYGTCLGTSGQSAMNFWIAEPNTTLEAFQSWLSTHNLQVEYELATPITMQFDPIAIRSDGVTNISVNCGEVTELKYFSETP